jgi:hypothetical protein
LTWAFSTKKQREERKTVHRNIRKTLKPTSRPFVFGWGWLDVHPGSTGVECGNARLLWLPEQADELLVLKPSMGGVFTFRDSPQIMGWWKKDAFLEGLKLLERVMLN